jgi:arylsulfatase A-like enzyme
MVLGLLLATLPSAGSRPPVNAVLIVLDTVRADHLHRYGYGRNTSPRIDGFAAGATQYDRAIAPSSWTLPSHASMFTAKHSFEHGAHRVDPAEREGFRSNSMPLGHEHLTIAEVFDTIGYATGDSSRMMGSWGHGGSSGRVFVPTTHSTARPRN